MKFSHYLINAIRQLDRAVRVRGIRHTISLAFRVLFTEGPAGIRQRLDALGPAFRAVRPENSDTILILTVPHTMHFAQRLQVILAEVGLEAVISDNDRIAKDFNVVFSFALQNFPAVPLDRCIAFQVEQSILPHRWTPDYLARLAKCRAVFEYSQTNINALNGHVPSFRLFLVPLAPLLPPKSNQTSRNVLFYGDTSPARRAVSLEKIRKTVPELEIETNLFGPHMSERLRQAAIVLNIHAQAGGLLESARISEALAHGCVVISETSPDQDEYGYMNNRVLFTPEGDTEAMAAVARKLLDDRHALNTQEEISFAPMPDLYRLGVLRALLGLDLITPETFETSATDYPVPFRQTPEMPRICLSLPETPSRTQSFLAQNLSGFIIWPGLKANPGWRGAALSYRHIMRSLRRAEIHEALIVEDDVILPSDFETKLQIVRHYMDDCNADLFSGLIVDLHKQAQVLDVTRRDGLTLVQLDRAVMMICNLYRQRMIDYLARWDDHNNNAFSNTIDRYMERATHLRVVTTLPFMASYRTSLQSTLRNADNHKFDTLLAYSEALLTEKVVAFEASRQKQ